MALCAQPTGMPSQLGRGMQPAYPKRVWLRQGTPPHSMGGTAHRPVHSFWHQEDPQTGFSRRPSVTQSYTGLPLLPSLTAAKCPLMTAMQSSIHSHKARVFHLRQVQHSRVYGCFAHSGPAIDDGSRRGQRSTRSSTFVTRANGRSTSPTPISSNQISRRSTGRHHLAHYRPCHQLSPTGQHLYRRELDGS